MKALLIAIAVLFFASTARAENVDWSQYLETKSDRPLTKVGSSSKPETVAKTKAGKKKAAKASKQKARKGKAKAKRARRR